MIRRDCWYILRLPTDTWRYLEILEDTWLYLELGGDTWLYLELGGNTRLYLELGVVMSYLRPPRLQPERLEVQAGLAWCRATVQVDHTLLYCTESVPRREEGSTGKYQHEVEGTPETECWYFPVIPDSSQGTDIIQFIKVMKL